MAATPTPPKIFFVKRKNEYNTVYTVPLAQESDGMSVQTSSEKLYRSHVLKLITKVLLSL